MRLKSIKLAGFKSFVDPTTVTFPGDLCGVVGPNGCGKSNIIDAVRWVMGESSAKQLRGDSMADVIFNGSTERQPVGQANIELIFDNSSGRVGGEYAAYNEISVKRRVMRDGNNDYFLNGGKCRRRDITDIFLGTGLGPRSYSIIEQGMISTLITAKPEDLRVYIEEAAGISKYKERRRDTENRIRRTRDNLERLTDIREELHRLLLKLQRQAKAAEKFREYKTQQRELNKQLLSLQWQQHDQRINADQTKVNALNVELEKRLAAEAKTNRELEESRQKHNESNQQLNEIQAQFYNEGAEISRLEQQINHNQQRAEQLNQEQQDTEKLLTDIGRDLKQDDAKISGWTEEIAQLTEQMETSKKTLSEQQEKQQQADQQMQQWQQQWDRFSVEFNDVEREAQIQKSSIEHTEQLLKKQVETIQRLEQEIQTLQTSANHQELQQQLNSLQQQQQDDEKQIAVLQKQLEERQGNRQQLRTQQSELLESLNMLRLAIQKQSGQLSSLKALQENVSDNSLEPWLKKHQLDKDSILFDQLQVQQGWETAVEVVLGQHLQGRCTKSISAHQQAIETLSQSLALISPSHDESESESFESLLSLSSVLSGDYPSFLDSIYLAKDLSQAMNLHSKLANHQSIVTAQGQWLGNNWLLTHNTKDAKLGVLKRQQDIADLEQQLDINKNQEIELLSQLAEIEKNIADTELTSKQNQQTLNQLIQHRSVSATQASKISSQLEQWQFKNKSLNEEYQTLKQQSSAEQQKLQQMREKISQSVDKMANFNEKKQQRLQQRTALEDSVKQAREAVKESGNLHNQIALRERTVQTQLSALKEAQQRLTEQRQRAQQRMSNVKQQLSADVQPVDDLQKQLDKRLKQRLTIEARLNGLRNKTNEIENAIRTQQEQLQQAQHQVQEQREEIQQFKLQTQETITLQKSIKQQLADVDVNEYLQQLDEGANIDSCQQQLGNLERRINQLGAVNLAAIEEYETEQERKHYLDKQNEELVEALSTLEVVIRKIDKETRTRFKETFDQINSGFKSLFPRLFGGGHAYLELTGDDLLNTGVAIMARPPGKRNATIHLLSGGEKALTAIALVFAIFHLNPAPFCMLDEVDAPLDDANVGRFADMVKEMSKKVQVIFISHNKGTMEMANQLMGVTMQEAGVSRVVSVNIDDAMEMIG